MSPQEKFLFFTLLGPAVFIVLIIIAELYTRWELRQQKKELERL